MNEPHPEILAELRIITNKLDGLHAETARMRRTLTGDSEPENGLAFRVKGCEDDIADINGDREGVKKWAWGAIGSAILGIVAMLVGWSKGGN
jgi:hypothetical protein